MAPDAEVEAAKPVTPKGVSPALGREIQNRMAKKKSFRQVEDVHILNRCD